MKYIILSLFFVLLPFADCFSQICTNELPISVTHLKNIPKQKNKEIISITPPDLTTVVYEDSVNAAEPEKGYRVGLILNVDYNSDKDGQWIELSDGGKIWQLTIQSKKAQSLDFIFRKFWLPKEGKFFVYNPHTLETIGAITSEYLLGDKVEPSTFSTGIVKGDIVTLEYYQPANVTDTPVIEVSGVTYGYRTLEEDDTWHGFGQSGTCQVNINCPDGDNWQDEKNAVVRIYHKGTYQTEWCTGFLVNTTSLDFKPYVISANHCIEAAGFDAITNPNESNSIFYWGFESCGCNDFSQPTIKSTVGATVVSNNKYYADFALLKLHQDPRCLSGYTPYYLGWDVSGNGSNGGVCIHHPRGDLKKIATYDIPVTSSSYELSAYSPSDSHWKVFWAQTPYGRSIPQPGSSGAPLLNQDHRAIGQLHGGMTACEIDEYGNDPDNAEYFGKMYTSWSGGAGSISQRRLSNWLDSIGTGQTTMDGCYYQDLQIDGSSCPCLPEVYSIHNLPSGYTVTWSFVNDNSLIDPPLLLNNHPVPNKCMVSSSLFDDRVSGRLVATIKRNGQIVTTRQKLVSNTYLVIGTYSQTSNGTFPSIPESDFGNEITINPDCIITLTCNDFNSNNNIEHTGATLDTWAVDSINHTITLKFPPSTTNKSINIIGRRVNGCAQFRIKVTATPSSINGIIMNAMLRDHSITISFAKENNTTRSPKRTIEIVNSATGQIVYNCECTDENISVDTTRWSPGLYIIFCKNGERIAAKKISVK